MISNKSKHVFTILGGDKRQAVIAEELLKRDHAVRIYGLSDTASTIAGAEICSSVEKAMIGCNVLILPLPVSRDNLNLLIQCDKSISIPLSYIIDLAVKNGCRLIVGGIIPREMQRLSEMEGILIEDFYLSESLQRKNALASAEGAVMISMEHTEKTVCGSKMLVCGFGRIGSRLATMLTSLGADVIIAARSDAALCEASMSGYESVRIGDDTVELSKTASESDVIFNTVPAIVFNKNVLRTMKSKPLYIEIASSPGGIDVCAAREYAIPVIFAPSIPGRYAPISAGEYIFDTIKEILSKRGIDI